jgi:hypothetical protein
LYPINRHFKLIALTEEDPTREKLPTKEKFVLQSHRAVTQLMATRRCRKDGTTVVAGSVAFFDLKRRKKRRAASWERGKEI